VLHVRAANRPRVASCTGLRCTCALHPALLLGRIRRLRRSYKRRAGDMAKKHATDDYVDDPSFEPMPPPQPQPVAESGEAAGQQSLATYRVPELDAPPRTDFEDTLPPVRLNTTYLPVDAYHGVPPKEFVL
jgi:hypothetical protein